MDITPWEPGRQGKAALYGSIDYPALATWVVDAQGNPHHYEVMMKSGIGNYMQFDIDPQGGLSLNYGDPKEADRAAALDPRLHVKSYGPLANDWNFSSVLRAHRSASSELHNWKPGSWGKGFVLNDGRPVTWSLDNPDSYEDPSSAGPHHVDYAMEMGLPGYPEGAYDKKTPHGGWHTPVYIKPNGEVNTLLNWPGAETNGLGPFTQLGLADPKTDDWHFAAAGDPNDPDQCTHCGSRALTPPKQVGYKTFRTCMNCGRSQLMDKLASHYNNWGQPCSCTFNKPDDVQFSNDTSALAKVAGKLHDHLMNPKQRPDMQEPEAQEFLQHLEQHYHNDKTDKLMPWLAREWKKGRVTYSGLNPSDPSLKHNTYYSPMHLSPQVLNHWADFYRSNHPLKREMGDIMQHQAEQFHERIQHWDDDLKRRAEEKENEKHLVNGGQVVHTTPDGWTIRNLTTPEELKAEGDAMGHCVGGYHDDVANGTSIIHSLRDPQGKPHATIEFSPNHSTSGGWDVPRCPHCGATDEWQGGQCYSCGYPSIDPKVEKSNVVQIQGKSNEEPKKEYQERIKHYFTHAFSDEDRPGVNDGSIDHIAQLADDVDYDERGYHDAYGEVGSGDYGLADRRDVEWNPLVESLVRNDTQRSYRNDPTYDPDHGQLVYDLARKRQQIPEFAKAVEHNGQKWQENYDDWRDMNREHWVSEPDPDEYSDPEDFKDAYERYEADEQNWIDEHAGMRAAHDLYGYIGNHWDPTQNAYVNENAHANQIKQRFDPESPNHPSTFSKQAGLTNAQLLRKQQLWNDSLGPDQAPVDHQFPDGWSIRKLNTNHAECYEGEMMPNCIGSADVLLNRIPQDAWHASAQIGSNPDYTYYSVRDPNNIPHATFAHDPDDRVQSFWNLGVEGRAGSNAARYAPYVHDWWTNKMGGKPVSPEAWEDEFGEDMHPAGSPEHQATNPEYELYGHQPPVAWWDRPMNGSHMPERLNRAVRPLKKAMTIEDPNEAEAFLRSKLIHNYNAEDVEKIVEDLHEHRAALAKHNEKVSPDSLKPYVRHEFPEFYWMHGSYGPEVYNVIKKFQEIHKGTYWNHPGVWRNSLVDSLVGEADVDPSTAEQIAAQWVTGHLKGKVDIPHVKVYPDEDKLRNMVDEFQVDPDKRDALHNRLRDLWAEHKPDPDFDPAQVWKMPAPSRRAALPDPQITEHEYEDGRLIGPRGYDYRRPVLYDRGEHHIHIGVDGGTHEDLARHVDLDPSAVVQGWVGHNPEADDWDPVRERGEDNEVGWYFRHPGQQVENALLKHFDAKPANEDEWHFASIFFPKIPAPQTPQQLAVGKQCYFHPDRPAVAAEAFAPMCEDCYSRWQHRWQQRPQNPQRVDYTSAYAPVNYKEHESVPDPSELGDNYRIVTLNDGRALTGHGHHHQIIQYAGLEPHQIKDMGWKYTDNGKPFYQWMADHDKQMREGWVFGKTALNMRYECPECKTHFSEDRCPNCDWGTLWKKTANSVVQDSQGQIHRGYGHQEIIEALHQQGLDPERLGWENADGSISWHDEDPDEQWRFATQALSGNAGDKASEHKHAASNFEIYRSMADPKCKVCYGQGSMYDPDTNTDYPCYRCVRGKVPPVRHDMRRDDLGWKADDQRQREMAKIPVLRDLRDVYPIDPNPWQLNASVRWAAGMTPGHYTGDPGVDRLIDEFKFEEWHNWMRKRQRPTQVAEMDKPNEAYNVCNVISWYFADFMKRHGYEVGEQWTHANEIYPDWTNATGKEKFGLEHMVNTITTSSGSYIIDWSAAQYGVGAVPKVTPVGQAQLHDFRRDLTTTGARRAAPSEGWDFTPREVYRKGLTLKDGTEPEQHDEWSFSNVTQHTTARQSAPNLPLQPDTIPHDETPSPTYDPPHPLRPLPTGHDSGAYVREAKQELASFLTHLGGHESHRDTLTGNDLLPRHGKSLEELRMAEAYERINRHSGESGRGHHTTLTPMAAQGVAYVRQLQREGREHSIPSSAHSINRPSLQVRTPQSTLREAFDSSENGIRDLYHNSAALPTWGPGHFGKGFVADDGRVIHWGVNSRGAPHHTQVGYGIPHEMFSEFEIQPDGQLYFYGDNEEAQQKAYDAHPDFKPYRDEWNFGSVNRGPRGIRTADGGQPWNIVRGMTTAEDTAHDDGEVYEHHPLWIDHDTRTAYMGHVGSHHVDLMDEFGLPYEKAMKHRALIYPHKDGWLYESDSVDPDPELLKSLSDHVGAPVRATGDWHFASGTPGSESATVFAGAGEISHSWDDPAVHYPDQVPAWKPGTLGKGVVSPEGRAYAWSLSPGTGVDGYPSHDEGLRYLADTAFGPAADKGWAFYQIHPDGGFRNLMGPAELDQRMKSYLPQGIHCEGCGSPVDPNEHGEYSCPNCHWQGATERGRDNDEWHFASDLNTQRPWTPGVRGKGYITNDGQAFAWTPDAHGNPHHHKAIYDNGHSPFDVTTFELAPTGAIRPSFWTNEAQIADKKKLIEQQIPGALAQRPEEGWHFAAQELRVVHTDDDGAEENGFTWDQKDTRGGRIRTGTYPFLYYPNNHVLGVGAINGHHDPIHDAIKDELGQLPLSDPGKVYGWIGPQGLHQGWGDNLHPEAEAYLKQIANQPEQSDEWHFASSPVKFVHHKLDEEYKLNKSRFTQGYEGRIPLVYDPIGNTVHYSDPDYSHYDVYQAAKHSMGPFLHQMQGWVGRNPEAREQTNRDQYEMHEPYSTFGFYSGRPNADVENAIKEHFGIGDQPPEDMSEWHFAKTGGWDERPVIYNGTQAVVGKPGAPHASLAKSIKTNSDSWFGYLDGGELHWMGSHGRSLPGPNALDAVTRAAGQPVRDMSEEEWRFAKTAAPNQMLWNPPNTGKGFVAGGRIYTWNTSGNKPHHWEMHDHFKKSDPNLPTMQAAFGIDPQGQVTKEYGDPAEFVDKLGQDPRLTYEPESWTFSSRPDDPRGQEKNAGDKPGQTAPRWKGRSDQHPVDRHDDGENEPEHSVRIADVASHVNVRWGGDPQMADPQLAGEHPVIWDGEDLVIGHEGLHHSDAYPAYNTVNANHNGVINPSARAISWFSNPPFRAQLNEAASKHLGVPLKDADPDDAGIWNFASAYDDVDNRSDEINSNNDDEDLTGTSDPRSRSPRRTRAKGRNGNDTVTPPKLGNGQTRRDSKTSESDEADNENNHGDSIAPNVVNGNHHITNYLGNPTDLHTVPWKPGLMGKGALIGDKLHMWAFGKALPGWPGFDTTDFFDPHHDGIYDHITGDGPDEGYAQMPKVLIQGDGTVEGLRSTHADPDNAILNKIISMHPDLKGREDPDEWHFGSAEDGEDYGWPLSESHAKLHFPEGFESNGGRMPFVYTLHRDDPNDVNIYMGHPNSEHYGIMAPDEDYHSYSEQKWVTQPAMHPGLHERLQDQENVGGYGSVKPRSFYTGRPEDRKDNSLEFYTVHEPQVLGTVADAISAHQPFGLKHPSGFKNEEKQKHNPEEDEWYFEGKVADFQLPELDPRYKRPMDPIKPEEIQPWVPGQYGKFVGYEDGTFKAWGNQPNAYWPEHEEHETARDGWPSHYAVGEALGKEPSVENKTTGYIAPDGRVEVYGKGNNWRDHLGRLLLEYPETYHEDEPDTWHFANDDPYYDPEFDEKFDENEFDRQIKHKMVNPPDDDTILALVGKGWEQGTDGKAIELSDGTKLTWTPDEHGSPHHNDVLKALGIRDTQGIRYLIINPDGTTYDYTDIDPEGTWDF